MKTTFAGMKDASWNNEKVQTQQTRKHFRESNKSSDGNHVVVPKKLVIMAAVSHVSAEAVNARNTMQPRAD
jgi:hypothetical protein